MDENNNIVEDISSTTTPIEESAHIYQAATTDEPITISQEENSANVEGEPIPTPDGMEGIPVVPNMGNIFADKGENSENNTVDPNSNIKDIFSTQATIFDNINTDIENCKKDILTINQKINEIIDVINPIDATLSANNGYTKFLTAALIGSDAFFLILIILILIIK